MGGGAFRDEAARGRAGGASNSTSRIIHSIETNPYRFNGNVATTG